MKTVLVWQRTAGWVDQSEQTSSWENVNTCTREVGTAAPSPLCHRASTSSATYKDKIWLWPDELSCLLTRKANVFSELCVKLDTSTELVLIGWTSWKGQVKSVLTERVEGVKKKKEREDGRKLVQRNSEEEEERRLVLMTYHFYNIHVDLCEFLTLLVSLHECILLIYPFESRTFATLRQRGRASLSSAPLSSFWGKFLLTDGSL